MPAIRLLIFWQAVPTTFGDRGHMAVFAWTSGSFLLRLQIQFIIAMIQSEVTKRPINTPRQVLFASLVGTTVEFFDFYIYATAAVLVFPRIFFPASVPASPTCAS